MAATARAGQWLPYDKEAISKYVEDVMKQATNTKDPGDRKGASTLALDLHPCIEELKDLIETDPEVYMLFTTMFTQKPVDPHPGSVHNYTDMLVAMNHIMTIAPKFSDSDMVGVPLNALLLYPMATPSGTTAFLNDKVNQSFRKILRH